MEDMNTKGYLDRVKNIVLEHVRHIGGPPSVQMHGNFDILFFLFMKLTIRP